MSIVRCFNTGTNSWLNRQLLGQLPRSAGDNSWGALTEESYVYDVDTNLWVPSTGGIQFNGVSNRYVQLPGTGNLSYEWDQPFTIASWVRPNTGGAGYILSKFTEAALFFGYGIGYGSNTFAFWVVSDENGMRIHCDNTFTDRDAWYHVVAINEGTGDAVDNRIYVNGVEQAFTIDENDLNELSILNNVNVNAGARNNGQAPYGNAVSQTAVWDVGLSTAEVEELYGGGTFPWTDLNTLSTASDLQLWWRMDQYTSVGTTPDLSASGFDGTNVGLTTDYLVVADTDVGS